MKIKKCIGATTDPFSLEWADVRYSEGVYRQTGNRAGFVIVLGPAQVEGIYVAMWTCGEVLTAYNCTDPSTRFDRVNAEVCLEVRK